MQIDRRLTKRPAPVRPRRSFKLALPGFHFWLAVGALGILGALAVLLSQILLYARSLDRLPAGLVIASVPVGGLSNDEATARLNEVYSLPVTLDYRGNAIQLVPSQVGFTLDTQAMLAQAPNADPNLSLWSGLWGYLWAQTPDVPAPIPLQASYDQSKLESFLAEIATRYDDIGTPARANPDTLSFIGGSAGRTLDRESASVQINTALRSATDRKVTLLVKDEAAVPPSFENLDDLLYTDINLHQFTGMVHIYVSDLKTGEVVNIAMNNGQKFPVADGIAISGMSTIKIAVMVTFFRYKDGDLTPDEQLLFNGIFGESANAYTDLVLGIIGANNSGGGLVGANLVSDTMATLGLKNTYLAGLLDTLGAITTPRITPGNSRTDIDLNPDLYSQTSADDMGQLLVMVYQCSQGTGKLMDTFPGQFTAEECQQMIHFLSENAVGPIFLAGSAPGATVVHKHGWDLLPLNNVGDAAIIKSPGGDYVMTVYIHRDEPVPFDDANRLIVSLGTVVFNYYNHP
jgi:beta-lactamase class A